MNGGGAYQGAGVERGAGWRFWACGRGAGDKASEVSVGAAILPII